MARQIPMSRTSFLDMNEDELRDLVRKLRKERLRLKARLKAAKQSPDWFEAQGNNGGSYVRMSSPYPAEEGMVQLEVGETCVRTIKEKISVVALAAILTAAKDEGFQKVADRYMGHEDHFIKVDIDPIVERDRKARAK